MSMLSVMSTADSSVRLGDGFVSADANAATQVALKGAPAYRDVNLDATANADASIRGGGLQANTDAQASVSLRRYFAPKPCEQKYHLGRPEFLCYQPDVQPD